MGTVFHTNPINPQQRHLVAAAQALEDGNLIAYPTDTTYGIGCDLLNKRGIEKIYALKKRDRRKPVSILCADLKQLSQYGVVSNSAYRVMRRYLPGPYTFILPATPLVPKIMLTPQKTVGVRIPDSQIIREIIENFGRPMINTSAKLPDGTTLNDPDDIEKYFRGKIDIIIAGPCSGEPSSIVDFTNEDPEIIRVGHGDLSFMS